MFVNLPGNAPFSVTHARDTHPARADFPLHAHSHYEILIFISGDITYLVEGNAYTPHQWDVLLFNIAETHKVLLHSDAPYERVVIRIQKDLFLPALPYGRLLSPFRDRAPGERNLLHPADFRDELWKLCTRRLCELEEASYEMSLPLLLPLLHELTLACDRRDTASSDAKEDHTQAAAIVRYINSHLTEDLSPATLARTFLLSRTALYALFRRATGTGIHDYINVKRLILARERLQSGERPTKVCEQVGFREYTTFFRAYKKLFGTAPGEGH